MMEVMVDDNVLIGVVVRVHTRRGWGWLDCVEGDMDKYGYR